MNTLASIQALRALAAWLVVLDHAMLVVAQTQNYSEAFVRLAWSLGEGGVYIFFVISGFVMVHTSFERFGSARSVFEFCRRRFDRIVPLYWLMTLVAFVLHQIAKSKEEGLSDLVKSLLFIPYANHTGAMFPVLQQGWTLNYEMMFYCIFAIGMLFRLRFALSAILVALCALPLVSTFVSTGPVAAFLMRPIVLLFAAGVFLGWIYRGRGMPQEPRLLVSFCRPLKRMGDASYSLYLVHGLVLTALAKAMAYAFHYLPGPEFVCIGFAFATMVGLVMHYVLEEPLLRWTRRLTDRLWPGCAYGKNRGRPRLWSLIAPKSDA
jgi:exopolysaccharide production protein ExoZ